MGRLAPRAAAALLAIPLLDELWTAVPVIEAPQIEQAHGLAHAGMAITLLVAPLLVGAIAEARLVLWAERGNARRWIAMGQLVVALMVALAAVAPSAWLLSVAIGIAGSAGGVVGSLGQGALVEHAGDAREQAMARWALASAIGDLAAPLTIAALAAFGLGWQVALLVIALVIAVHAIACMRSPIPTAPVLFDDDDDDGDTETSATPHAAMRLRDALRHRPLVLWLAATAACTVVDEILLAFAALHLRLDRGAHEATIAVFAAVVAGAEVIGLVVVERMLARGASARRMLGISAAACTIACATWWVLPGTTGPLVMFGLLGVAAAPLYPIAAARAYATVPGRAALVAAAGQLFVVVDLVAPWLLGVAADRFGISSALAVIAVGPLVLLGFAAWPARWRDDQAPPMKTPP